MKVYLLWEKDNYPEYSSYDGEENLCGVYTSEQAAWHEVALNPPPDYDGLRIEEIEVKE